VARGRERGAAFGSPPITATALSQPHTLRCRLGHATSFLIRSLSLPLHRRPTALFRRSGWCLLAAASSSHPPLDAAAPTPSPVHLIMHRRYERPSAWRSTRARASICRRSQACLVHDYGDDSAFLRLPGLHVARPRSESRGCGRRARHWAQLEREPHQRRSYHPPGYAFHALRPRPVACHPAATNISLDMWCAISWTRSLVAQVAHTPCHGSSQAKEEQTAPSQQPLAVRSLPPRVRAVIAR